jgi:putative DNA primase/helicase
MRLPTDTELDQAFENAKLTADKYIAADGGPPRSAGDMAELERLAKLSPLQYEREREAALETLGIGRVKALDDAVKAQRHKDAKEQKNFLPHWNVEAWPEPVDGDALLQDLRAHLKRYVILSVEKAEVALALWVLHTWVFECFDITPYLCINSPTRRCGKTVLMTMLYWLCCRAKKNDSMSKAAIYRGVERDKPTLVLDEVGWVVDQKDERQNILCGGFERNGHAEVCEGEGADIAPRLYSTFCPKAFGLIGKLTATLMDRSIEIPMQRKKDEKVERLRRRDNNEHAQFRRRCLRWANDNTKALATLTPALPDKLNDRAIDYWEPLLAIAQHVGSEWSKLATDAALVLSGDDENTGEERGVELLRDIQKFFESSAKIETTTKTLIVALCVDEERPWATYYKGKPITDRQVGRLLRPFGIISETVHPPGEKDAKGYKLERFQEAFERYLNSPKASQSGILTSRASERPNADGMGTTGDFCVRPENNLDAHEKCKLSHSHAGLDAWTDKSAGNGAQSVLAKVEERAEPDEHHCAQCGRGGDLLETYFGGADPVWLHRDCQDAWRAAQDDLTIPAVLDRRDEPTSIQEDQ